MLSKETTTCRVTKPDGTPCQAPVLPGSEYCFFHDPKKAEERRLAQSHGGKQGRHKVLSDETPDVQIRDCRDILVFIETTINQLRRGEVDPRIANSLGYLLNLSLKAIDQGTTERRLAELEAVIKVPRKSTGIDNL